MAVSDVGAEYTGHHAADVQERHEAAPSVLFGSLTLHAGETAKPEQTCRGDRERVTV